MPCELHACRLGSMNFKKKNMFALEFSNTKLSLLVFYFSWN